MNERRVYGLRWGRIIALSMILLLIFFGEIWFLNHDATDDHHDHVTHPVPVSAELAQKLHEKILASELPDGVTTENPENIVVFSEAVRSNNPFLMRSTQKDNNATLPARTLPSIPAVSYPRPVIPSVAARPLSPPESVQHAVETAPVSQKEPTEKKYADPIAFIHTDAGSAAPSDAITYYGGDHLTVGENEEPSPTGEK